jgi:hypothetical protein
VVSYGYRSRGPRFHSRHYQIFWEVVGLERGPLSLMSITEELLEWKSSSSGSRKQINGHGDLLRWPRDTLYLQKMPLTSLTSSGRSVGIVRLRTKDMECLFVFVFVFQVYHMITISTPLGWFGFRLREKVTDTWSKQVRNYWNRFVCTYLFTDYKAKAWSFT